MAAFELRDDFVTATFDGKPVDVTAAKEGAEIAADAREVESHRGDFIAIEDDFGLRDVKLQIGIGEDKEAGLKGFCDECVGELEKFPRFSGGGDHELDGIIAATRECRGNDCDDVDARDSGGFSKNFISSKKNRGLSRKRERRCTDERRDLSGTGHQEFL